MCNEVVPFYMDENKGTELDMIFAPGSWRITGIYGCEREVSDLRLLFLHVELGWNLAI
jgi:hypothetical protein